MAADSALATHGGDLTAHELGQATGYAGQALKALAKDMTGNYAGVNPEAAAPYVAGIAHAVNNPLPDKESRWSLQQPEE